MKLVLNTLLFVSTLQSPHPHKDLKNTKKKPPFQDFLLHYSLLSQETIYIQECLKYYEIREGDNLLNLIVDS